MSASVRHAGAVIPAELSYLAIYNPSLGTTDETLRDQIVFHSSKATRERRRHRTKDGQPSEDMHEEENERLRQIGLAQGMVEFARGFADGKAVDSVETEKSRIILHEIESGWWIIASVDLTRITSSPDPKPHSDKPATLTEYSAREVCPSGLLLQHIMRAHSIFLLHHGPSLNDLYIRLTRAKFCGALDRFWARFIRNWDVLLHGNPAVDVFNGLKLAAGGELGIGVGEEEWGSGEREVLEGFIGRTEGLVDLVVSRFGEPPQEPDSGSIASHPSGIKPSIEAQKIELWLGDRNLPAPQDGVIFSGAGYVARKSLKSISSWMEWLYKYGDDAYGIRDNPNSAPRRKRKPQGTKSTKQDLAVRNSEHVRTSGIGRGVQGGDVYPSGIPPPIVTAIEKSLAKATAGAKPSECNREMTKSKSAPSDESAFGTENVMKYLTLGIYGSSWGFSAKMNPFARGNIGHGEDELAGKVDTESPGNHQTQDDAPPMQDVDPEPESSLAEDDLISQKLEKSIGRFAVGLRGDLENETATDDEMEVTGPDIDRDIRRDDSNSRITIRTLHVERVKVRSDKATDESVGSNGESEQSSPNYYDKLRVVVYVHQPFIFTFLFEMGSESLAMSSFYRSLHHQLGPLQRPLLSSTSPANVSQRLWDASAARSTASSTNAQPIYDLVYDPSNLSIHTSIPNIPEPGTAAAEGLGSTDAPWTRVEALNVHSQILHTHIDTRRHAHELERTCKTNRGWWVVWMRLPHSPASDQSAEDGQREALLIRKASDYVAPAARSISSRFGRDVSDSSAAGGWGAGKLAEGIGIDSRKYIESLLSLNR